MKVRMYNFAASSAMSLHTTASAKNSTGSTKNQKNQVILFNGKTDEERDQEFQEFMKIWAEDARNEGNAIHQEEDPTEGDVNLWKGFDENDPEYQELCRPWEVSATIFSLGGTKKGEFRREFGDGFLADDFLGDLEDFIIAFVSPLNVQIWQNSDQTLLIIEDGTVVNLEMQKSWEEQ